MRVLRPPNPIPQHLLLPCKVLQVCLNQLTWVSVSRLLTPHWLLDQVLRYFLPPQLSSNRHRQRSEQNKGEGQSVILHISLFNTILTSHLGALEASTATVTAIPSLSSSSPAAASEGGLTAGPDNGAPITPSPGAASLSQPTLDLGVSISAADTSLAAELGAPLIRSTQEDTTEPSKRRIIKLRKRANGNTSDSFIQRYIDFAFRSCSI